MADSGREEKLAAARKKLKKFQQKRTPSSSPAVKEVKHTVDSSSIYSSSSSESGGNPSASENNVNSEFHDLHVSSSPPINGNHFPEEHHTHTQTQHDVSAHIFDNSRSDEAGPSSSNHREYTTTEKLKQLCSQLNGLSVNQDLYINGDDPVFHEIKSLEGKNHELEDKVQSYKRSNEQLNNQVNEQRRQIIQFQEQIKRERTELANKQLLEQRSLKEQLEVHIQTIGILVGEKQELQSTVSQLQRKYEIKQSENTELTSRLQTVRQKAAELEKNLANVTASCDKYQDDAKQLRQERDKYQTTNYTQNQEKEELLQQNAELRVKLEAKVAECEELNKTESELSFKLKQAQLVVQQLSGEPSSSASQKLVEQLQNEKAELESKLEQVNKTVQRLAADKGELLQQHADEVDQYERRIRSLTEEVELHDREKRLLIAQESALQESVQSLQKELADLQDNDASQQVESTQLAAAEIERLVEDKQRLAEHLQQEGKENTRLLRDQERFVLRIHELETAVARLGEESIDKATLLESVQSDKETISRALKQNKELKTKTEELEERFITMSQENMDLTSSLETERHMAKELAAKLSEMGVELEESKQMLSVRNAEVQSLTEELQTVSNTFREEVSNGESVISSLRDELDLSSQQFVDQLKKKEFELSTVREEVDGSSHQLREQLAKKDLELASLKEELSQSEARLTEQFLLNDDSQTYKDQAELASGLQQELQLAKDTISHLRVENSQLKELLATTENRSSLEHSGSESSDEDDKGHVMHHISNGSTDNEDGEIHIKRLGPPDVIPVQAAEHMMEETPPYMNGDLSEGESPAETDSSEDMNMAPQGIPPPPPLSKYTNREDMVDSLSASIRQLEMERDQLADILHRTQDQQEDDFLRLQQHLELQLKQQLQQQYRQVQEQFQQQLHEQQQKIQLLQAVVEKQKEQIERKEEPELPNVPLEELGQKDMSHDEIKMAFSKLQARFMKLMNEKASLIERIQELEHVTVQLSHETETIGEYITLYQTQRNALKAYYKDREKMIGQMSSEKANMQEKMNQLQDLVKQMLDERKELRIQQHQLQNVINSRMVAHEHESVISAYQDGDEVVVPETEVTVEHETDNRYLDDSDQSRDSYLEETETELSRDLDNDEDQNDGTARQILQILEQLGPSEEGTHKSWMSPDVRSREFLPCRYCGGRVLRL